VVLTTVGAVFAPVVKLKAYGLTSWSPVLSLTAPAGIVTVYFVLPIKLLVGFIINVSELIDFWTGITVPARFLTTTFA